MNFEEEVMREGLIKLREKIFSDKLATREDIEKIKGCSLEQLSELAVSIRNRYNKNEFELCTIINGRSGRCSEDCKFCAQSGYYQTGIDEYDFLDERETIDSAVRNFNNGVNRVSIVTSGKNLNNDEVDELCRVYEEIQKKCEIKLCSSNGLLNYEQLKKLKESGVARYHNNLETSRRFFQEICTTHSFDEKIDTIKAAKRAGLEICSGGIFGMGESLDDRIDMAFILRELEVSSIPLNLLNPIKDTPFENRDILDYNEYARSIALFRIILPRAKIRLAGGRALLDDKGIKAINAGADSMISGEMLTTEGITTKSDINMLNELGFEVKNNG